MIVDLLSKCARAVVLLTTPLCGAFAIDGSPFENARQVGMDVEIKYDVTDCGGRCRCDAVLFLQLVRATTANGRPVWPSDEAAARGLPSGWYVDRARGRRFGFYGMNDDGTLAFTVTAGSSQDTARLIDTPRRGRASARQGIRWEAISVPVCLDGTVGCSGRWLSGISWGWTALDGRSPVVVAHRQDERGVRTLLLDAIERWNAQARTIPEREELSHFLEAGL